MDIDNMDPEYVEHVQSAMDALHCPACGGKAYQMSLGWSHDLGAFIVAPVFSCDTPGCEYNSESDLVWTPVSIL